MSIGQWYVSRGRITRRTFWLSYVLPIFLLGILASVADLVLGFATRTTATSGSAYGQMGLISVVVSLLTLVPSISPTAPRLHDQDRSALWLLFALIPLVGWLVLLVLNGFVAGTPGPNRYGPPAGGPQFSEPPYPQSYA